MILDEVRFSLSRAGSVAVIAQEVADVLKENGYGVCTSLDHLVGAQQELFRQLEAECLGDDEVDNQLELGRLFNRKLACLCAAQNFVDILGCTPEQVRDVRPIRH